MSRIAIAVGAAVVLLAATSVSAADSAKDLVKYRQAVMMSLAGHMAAIEALVKHEVPYDNLKDQAKALAATAPVVRNIFPADSGPSHSSKTHALAKIWRQPQDFQKKIDAFETAVTAFAADVQGGNMSHVMSGLKQVGMSCGGCHHDYRKKMQRH